jgi:hypothetical protein
MPRALVPIVACSLTAGCVHPSVAPSQPLAVAPAMSKVAVRAELVEITATGLAVVAADSTLAQSGEGPLGDRVFRTDPHGMLEGCRYVASGRICELVTLPDGSLLGGALRWMLQPDAPATPRAAGWVVRLNPLLALNAGGFLAGDIFYCRFTDTGPACLAVPTAVLSIFEPLGVFSLAVGEQRTDVLWIEIRPSMAVGSVATRPGVITRCETTEDAPEVLCEVAALP